MSKALTREDLLYILENTFRLSKQLDNALQLLEDGLYVQNIDNHEQDTSLHIDERLRGILDKFTVDDSGNLYFNTHLMGRISKKANNALQQVEDGMYVESIHEEAREHLKNDDIHVTKEQKDEWTATLKNAKDYAWELYNNIVIHDFETVPQLPTEDILSTRLYFWTEDPDKPEEVGAVPYIHFADQWHKITITKQTLQKLREEFDKKLESYVQTKDYHEHDNLDVLDKFSETEDGVILFDGRDIRHIFVSEENDNAIVLKDGKLYAKDYSDTIHALQVGAAFSMDVLYNKECTESGKYDLEYSIDEFSMIIIDYYYKPNDPEQGPGNAKSVMINVSTLNELYNKGIDYMLELGYGVSVSNSKISMHETSLYVNYYHNVCIYRITGIRKSGGEE